MPIHISVPINMFKEVQKRMFYKFGDKERQRSNRANEIREAGATARQCFMRHDQIAWSGPQHNGIRATMGHPPEKVLAYVCLRCGAAAADPEIKDRGWEFDTIPDWEIHTIMDLDLERQASGTSTTFGMYQRAS
jgi:hypothetical protein